MSTWNLSVRDSRCTGTHAQSRWLSYQQLQPRPRDHKPETSTLWTVPGNVCDPALNFTARAREKTRVPSQAALRQSIRLNYSKLFKSREALLRNLTFRCNWPTSNIGGKIKPVQPLNIQHATLKTAPHAAEDAPANPAPRRAPKASASRRVEQVSAAGHGRRRLGTFPGGRAPASGRSEPAAVPSDGSEDPATQWNRGDTRAPESEGPAWAPPTATLRTAPSPPRVPTDAPEGESGAGGDRGAGKRLGSPPPRLPARPPGLGPGPDRVQLS